MRLKVELSETEAEEMLAAGFKTKRRGFGGKKSTVTKVEFKEIDSGQFGAVVEVEVAKD